MTGETRGERVRGWLAARSFRQIVFAVGAVILLLSGAFGGLSQTEPDDERAALTVDEPHLSEPIRLTVKRVAWSDDLGEVLGPSEFGRYLLVIADVSTNQDRSVDSFVVRETLRMQGLKGLAKSQLSKDPVRSEDADPQVIVTADRTRLSEIGPGLTYEVAFVWEQKKSEPLPDTIDLLTRSHQFRRSSLDDQENWFGSSDDAIGTFTVAKFGES